MVLTLFLLTLFLLETSINLIFYDDFIYKDDSNLLSNILLEMEDENLRLIFVAFRILMAVK